MHTSAFAAALDGLFEGPLEDGVPADPRFAAIAADVAGHSTPAELAVLNLAARLLPAGEAYLEVGTLKGRSMAGTNPLDKKSKKATAVKVSEVPKQYHSPSTSKFGYDVQKGVNTHDIQIPK